MSELIPFTLSGLTLQGKVVDVYDGDTVTFVCDDPIGRGYLVSIKVRFSGIDTPEIRTKNEYEKLCALKARDFLKSILLEKNVTVVFEGEGGFGRYLGIVMVAGININNLMIEKKYAVIYERPKPIINFEQLYFELEKIEEYRSDGRIAP